MKSESTQDGLRAALNRYDEAYRGGRIDIQLAAIALAEEVRAALAAQPEPPAEETEYGFDRTKEHSEHFGAPPTENTVEAARAAVRDAIARWPGAIPVSALAAAEAAIRADERSKTILGKRLVDGKWVTGVWPLDERPKAQPESALRALLHEFRALPLLRGTSGSGKTFTVTFPDTGWSERVDAALDGAPHEPSEAVVERVALLETLLTACVRMRPLIHSHSKAAREARIDWANLLAALSEEAIDA